MEPTINISIIRDTNTVLDTLRRVYNARIRKVKTGYRLRVTQDKTGPFKALLTSLESDGFINIIRNRKRRYGKA